MENIAAKNKKKKANADDVAIAESDIQISLNDDEELSWEDYEFL